MDLRELRSYLLEGPDGTWNIEYSFFVVVFQSQRSRGNEEEDPSGIDRRDKGFEGEGY